jgi:hypothetical protein
MCLVSNVVALTSRDLRIRALHVSSISSLYGKKRMSRVIVHRFLRNLFDLSIEAKGTLPRYSFIRAAGGVIAFLGNRLTCAGVMNHSSARLALLKVAQTRAVNPIAIMTSHTSSCFLAARARTCSTKECTRAHNSLGLIFSVAKHVGYQQDLDIAPR